MDSIICFFLLLEMASSNFATIDCRIGGGSMYDMDMDLIENFVKVHNGIASPEIIRSVQLYYGSKILSYWSRFLDAMENDTAPVGILPSSPLDHNKFYYVKKNLKIYKVTYQNLLDKFEADPSLENIQ